MAGGRRSDPEASRAAILTAARACFSERGFAGTSLSDIASRAKVTQSLIHHHFGAKDALWKQVLATAFEEYAAKQSEQLAVDGHPKGLLRGSMAGYFAFLAAHPDLLRLMAWAELQGAEELTDGLAAVRVQALDRLRRGQQAGIIRGDVPAEHILTIFMGLARTWFEERNLVVDEGDPDATAQAGQAYLDAAWALFAGGVVAQSEAGSA